MPGRTTALRANIFVLAALIIFTSWLVDAQQGRHPQSPVSAVHATTIARDAAGDNARRKKTRTEQDQINQGAHSTHQAPAKAVASPSARFSEQLSQLTPRDLEEDWEVEDFVLLATVDGRLWARERETGMERWHIDGVPMVATTHSRRNRSGVETGYMPNTIDDYVWIIEPTQDGALYLYRPDGPNHGLFPTGKTMKQLVNEAPYQTDNPPAVYTGSKKTMMYTIDARTGIPKKWFGPEGTGSDGDKSCLRANDFGEPKPESCSNNATLLLGKTEYSITITGKDTHPIANLTYTEWGPNNGDNDLHQQHRSSKDKKHIYTGPDGAVWGFDFSKGFTSFSDSIRPSYTHQFPSPVARVFDVARPYNAEKEDAELIILPQPLPDQAHLRLISDSSVAVADANTDVFLNHTADGSLYAMSAKSYPLIDSKTPKRYHKGLWKQGRWDSLDESERSQYVVGLHTIDSKREPLLTISAPPAKDIQNNTPSVLELLPEAPAQWTQSFHSLPKMITNYVIDFCKNPILILVLLSVLVANQRPIRIKIGLLTRGATNMPEQDSIHNSKPVNAPEVPERSLELPSLAGAGENTANSTTPTINESPWPEETKPQERIAKNVVIAEIVSITDPSEEIAPSEEQTPKKKKKHPRGRRGGQKHKKGRGGAPSLQASEGLGDEPSIDDIVHDAQRLDLGQNRNIDGESRVATKPNNPADVLGLTLRIGALEVNTDSIIGTGSNGTIVYEGKFDGRPVAIKRMLIQFFDIASRETELLRESDDHPNVVRYYAQEHAQEFLYIALELCPAALSDVIEKPQKHANLAQAGQKDLPAILYQITNGLQHLHSLRIVHRDLKPQNILVSMDKKGDPRLLVSDFGLCRKLDNEQSSFRATTAHGAGTLGWRAPELLREDDAGGVPPITDGQSGSDEGSIIVDTGLGVHRRATRALDIFSLGLIFYYVLTQGGHPFDVGGSYMREVNIRNNNFELDQLRSLGDFHFEARNLIESMLHHEPKKRPTAKDVMAHPFFWSAKKRLNFLCDVSDHFEKEIRDPPSPALSALESFAYEVSKGDFLKPLGKEFVDSMGKQRKYTGSRLLDLLRALRNKKNHYEDMSDSLKDRVGPLPEGYLSFWTRKFPSLLTVCWNVVYELEWDASDRFKDYYAANIV